MTHDELRDYIDKFDAAGMVNEPAVKALRAIVELHKEKLDDVGRPVCSECFIGTSWRIYPCPTIRAIEEAVQL